MTELHQLSSPAQAAGVHTWRQVMLPPAWLSRPQTDSNESFHHHSHVLIPPTSSPEYRLQFWNVTGAFVVIFFALKLGCHSYQSSSPAQRAQCYFKNLFGFYKFVVFITRKVKLRLLPWTSTTVYEPRKWRRYKAFTNLLFSDTFNNSLRHFLWSR